MSYPHPKHFIVRNPGGRLIPLVAVDQLPDWIQLAGVPREMDAEQTVDMMNLGKIKDDDDAEKGLGLYEVQLRTDMIKAILSGGTDEREDSSDDGGRMKAATLSESSLSSSENAEKKMCMKGSKKRKEKKGRDAVASGPSKAGEQTATSTSSSVSRNPEAVKGKANAAVRAVSLLDCDSGSDSGGNIASPASLGPEQQIDAKKAQQIYEQQFKKTKRGSSNQKTSTAEPMLSSSRHSTATVQSVSTNISTTTNNNTGGSNNDKRQPQPQQKMAIHPTMTIKQAEMLQREKQQKMTRRMMSEHEHNNNNNNLNVHPQHQQQHHPFGVHGGDPNTIFCRHWCHHGNCKWGWDCHFRHQMPMDAEGLREVGLRDFPTWYLLLMNKQKEPILFDGKPPIGAVVQGGGGGRDQHLNNSNVGRNANSNSNTMATRVPAQDVRQQQQQHHQKYQHPSPVDLRVMQNRMAALLSGSTAVSKRQKRRQIKEIRSLFKRSSSNNNNNNDNLTDLIHPSEAAGYLTHQLARPHRHHNHSYHLHHHHRQTRISHAENGHALGSTTADSSVTGYDDQEGGGKHVPAERFAELLREESESMEESGGSSSASSDEERQTTLSGGNLIDVE